MLMWALIVIVALIALPFLIGFLLPVRYEGRTVVEFDQTVQHVWDALQDPNAHPMTGKMMKSVETQESTDGRPAWNEDMGRGEVIKVTTSVYEPPHRMTREMASGSAYMMSRWDYELQPAGDGCRVTLTGRTDIGRGTWHTPLFRFMMVVGGGVKKGLDIQLDMVASSLGAKTTRP